jgi:RNA polymerase sigma-70 factor, ECF subfamily
VIEQELIEKLQAGDRSAFKELFKTYNTMVFNVCLRMLGNQSEAEDITQDVFFKVYKSF